MSLPYRSTPLNTIEELQSFYGEKFKVEQTRFGQTLTSATADIKDIIQSKDYSKHGIVLSIEGTWGSGKSSFIQILLNNLRDENIAYVKYDSLYYGNVSEATDIFIKSIFDEVKEKYGVKLTNASSIAKNITPKLEISNGLPKFGLDFKATRPPTEVMKDQLEKKLNKLSGKMLIVIDDVDRVAEEDVVHFLRLVRVLRELPNFIIVLPIDRTMLENLLKTQGIESPKRYLEKIIDSTYDINPELGNSKDLFHSLITKKYSGLALSEDFINVFWDIYLWEISLATIRAYEVSGQQRFILNVGSSDALWQMLGPIRSQSGDNLVRKFMELTNANYGSGVNYVLRVKNLANTNEDIFQHYTQVLANMTFTDFMYANFSPNLGPDLSLENAAGASILSMKWWNDNENIITMQSDANKTRKTDYRVPIPTDPVARGAYFTDMNSRANYIWDTVRSLAGAYLPEIALQYLAPRTLNKIVDNLRFDASNHADAQRAEDYVELQKSVRRSIERSITINY